MGNLNCCMEKKNESEEENNKIYQINRDKTSEEKTEDNNDNNNNKYQILSYDIEENTLHKYYIKIPILTSLKGISEINLKSKLYLCGTSSTNKDSSSYLFQLDINNLTTKLMVNSNFCHYSPSLVAIYRDKIVCVGGKYCKECEIYDISIDHWSIIPELPEERYKSTLCFDYKNKFLYLFGGINTEKNKDYKYIEKDNILRISTKNYSFPIWEKIFVETKTELKLLNRVSSAAVFFGDNRIIIIGGENEEKKRLKNICICKFNNNKLSVESSGHQLDLPSKFKNQNNFFEYGFTNTDEGNFFYFFDSDNNIHIINKQQYISNLENGDMQISITSY